MAYPFEILFDYITNNNISYYGNDRAKKRKITSKIRTMKDFVNYSDLLATNLSISLRSERTYNRYKKDGDNIDAAISITFLFCTLLVNPCTPNYKNRAKDFVTKIFRSYDLSKITEENEQYFIDKIENDEENIFRNYYHIVADNITPEQIRSIGQSALYDFIFALLSNNQINLDEIQHSRQRDLNENELSIAKVDYYSRFVENNLYKVENRAENVTFSELIDIYIVPEVVDSNNKAIKAIPKKGTAFKRLITSESGIGKTTLLKALIVANTIETLYLQNPDILHDRTRDKLDEMKGNYKNHLNSIFGKLFENIDDMGQFFPVYVRACNVNKHQMNRYDNLKNEEKKDFLSFPKIFAEFKDSDYFEYLYEEEYKNNKVLLLIDGIDEIKINFYDKFKNFIYNYAEDNNVNIIVTTRFMGVQDLGFEEIHINHFAKQHIESYLSRLGILNKVLQEKLTTLLENNHIYNLAKNPFFLSQMVIDMDVRNSKNNPSSVIKYLVKGIVKRRWNAAEFGIKTEDIIFLLGYIAFYLAFTDQICDKFEELNIKEIDLTNIISQDTFINVFTKISKTKEDKKALQEKLTNYVKTMSVRSGILNCKSEETGEDYFTFQNELVAEYLAACYMVEFLKLQKYVEQETSWAFMSYLIHMICQRNNKLKFNEFSFNVFEFLITSENVHKEMQKGVVMLLILYGIQTEDVKIKENIAKHLIKIDKREFGENAILGEKYDTADKLPRQLTPTKKFIFNYVKNIVSEDALILDYQKYITNCTKKFKEE